MSHQTLFYTFGIALVLSALVVSVIGLRAPSFPANRGVLAGVIVFFISLVGATATFAVLNAQDEQAKTEAERAAASTAASTSTATTSTTQSTSTTASSSTTSTSQQAGGPGGTVDISADPTGQLAFEQKTVTSKPGPVKIDFTNQSPVGHDVKIQDSSGKVLGGTNLVSGGKASATVDLPPGTYTFFCDVPGHEQAGMKGTLTVK